jgi:flagellar protein FliJ
MMPKPSSLETLIELAQTRKDDAARHLGALNAEGADMEAKLSLLIQYSDEYRSRFQTSMQQGLSAPGLRNYHEFLGKLDAAVAQQREALELMRQRLAAGEVAWQIAGRVLSSYDTLARRHTRAELLRVAKREQRETDEHASGVAARRKSSR